MPILPDLLSQLHNGFVASEVNFKWYNASKALTVKIVIKAINEGSKLSF